MLQYKGILSLSYIMMIDALYNYRQGDIHSAEFSDEFNALCILFEESMTEAQLTTFTSSSTA